MKLSERRTAASPPYGVLLSICCGIAFICYFASYMRLPVVPLYARSLGADTVTVGMINSAFLLMAGVLSLPLGMISDRMGRKLLASLGLLVLSGTSFLLYFSRNPTQLMMIYFLFGIGLAAFGPTMMSIVADFSPSTHLGRSYGWYTTALYTGMSVGPAVGGFVAQGLGFLQVFVISGAFILLTFCLLVLFFPHSHKHLREAGQNRLSEDARELFKNRPLLACWLATIGGCFGLGMFITFLPLHAQNQHLSLRQIGIVFSAQGLSNAVSRIPFGHLSDRVTRRSNLVMIGLAGFIASMCGFGVATNLIHFLLFATTLGVSMGLAFTSVGALIAEVVPPQARGLAMGGYNSCIYLGMMLSSALMGTVIKRYGFLMAFLLTGVVNVLLAIAFHRFTRSLPAKGPTVQIVGTSKKL